jgi:thioredoxin-related protein
MKKHLILFLLFSVACFAQHAVNFRDGKFAEILKQARAENKPVFYMGYATWCPHCNKMKKDVMTDSLVADFYNRNFVCAAQDMEEGQGIAMRKKYHIKSYPTFLYLDGNGELLYSLSAELTAAEFIAEGKNALDPKKQLPFLKSQFSADPANAEHALAYISTLRKSSQDTDEAAKVYLATQTDAQLISAINWKIIANGIRDIDSREFQFVLKNQKEFAGVSSVIRVERKIINTVTETLNPFVESADTTSYFKRRPSAAAIHLAKTDSLIFAYDLRILERTKNWNAYRKVTLESVPKIAWNNAAQLKEIAMNYGANITDSEALTRSIGWTKRALELKDSYDCYLILARLYLKTGDKQSAKDWAEKARKMAVSYQWNTVEADNILTQIK